ncbi:MAG: cytochrome c biogenesis CcdA family protein [Campylobacterales bacterium]
MFEEQLIEFFYTAPFLVSFLAGILSFLAPCVLPMIPAYMSYISGLSVAQLNGATVMTRREHLRLIGAAAMFVLGFSAVFVTIGALSDFFIAELLASGWARLIGGAIIIVFGLHFMQIIQIPILNMQKQANFSTKISFFAPFVLGLSFAIGWTPCVGPILGSIIMVSAQEAGRGVVLMSLYALGLGIPFLLVAALTAWAFGLMNRIKKYFKIVEIVGGVLLIGIGGSIAYGGWQLVAQ